MPSVLIIDDDREFCEVLAEMIRRLGHQVLFEVTLAAGVASACKENFDLILLDARLPDGNGIEAIGQLRECRSAPAVIVITGAVDPDAAELAVNSGAWDYIEKPASIQALTEPLNRVLDYRRDKPKQRPADLLDREGIIGDSPTLVSSLEQLSQAAQSDISVLITGETGTGKELLAQAIHRNSHRKNAPFVVLDCGALPDSIVESMLFGHVKGAFTGAAAPQTGLIKQADGGTLFMDEVGELPLKLQKAFLRVLQEHRFRPLGGRREEHSDFRLVAATNRDLERMAQKKSFRSDLLYRLRSLVIESPPLRARPGDIEALTHFHMSQYCESAQIEPKTFSTDLFEILNAFHWPGNVRELFNAIDTALVAAHNEPTLYPYHLPAYIRITALRKSLEQKKRTAIPTEEVGPDPLSTGQTPDYKLYRTQLIADGEKRYFTFIVAQAKGNLKSALDLSGLSKSRLYHFLHKHGLSLKAPR